jgi:hypothetical protein
MLCGAANLTLSLLLARVQHVESLRERKVRRKVLVLRDRPFLMLTALSGVLALNWGLYDSGLPVWLTTHTHAPLWTMAALMVFNGVVIILLLNRFTQASSTVLSASEPSRGYLRATRSPRPVWSPARCTVPRRRSRAAVHRPLVGARAAPGGTGRPVHRCESRRMMTNGRNFRGSHR